MLNHITLDGDDWQVLHLLPQEWENRKVWMPDWEPAQAFPALDDWMPSSVPGDIIADSLRAGIIPQPFCELNSRQCEWLAQRDWVYRKIFQWPHPSEGATLKFEGVDYACRVYLNGKFLTHHEGTNTPFECAIDHAVTTGDNILVVVVFHAPTVEEVQGQVGHTSRARIWKPRYQYSWDWCTRLISLGIWRGVLVVAYPGARLAPPHINTKIVSIHDGTFADVSTCIDFPVIASHSTIHATLKIVGLNQKFEASATPQTDDEKSNLCFDMTLENVRLWWPNGVGNAYLYQMELTLFDGDTILDQWTQSIGFCEKEMRPVPGAPPNALPYQLVVNRQPIFIRGFNWVPLDHSVGLDQGQDRSRYERLIGLARDCGTNLLRVWGGGFLEARAFYELCDQLGILVWQEFFLSSSGIDNHPPENPAFIQYVADQARQIVPLRRHHTSVLLWCGGNELMDNDYHPLDSAHSVLAALKDAVETHDPGRPWLPCSPSGPRWHSSIEPGDAGQQHDVHGPWLYGGPVDHYQYYNKIEPLLHSEFGVEGAANPVLIRQFCSPDNEWPPLRSNPVWVHHGAWWLKGEMVEKVFGPIENLETFCAGSQWIQSDGLRYALESHRRRWPRCAGSLPWQFNEAFPNFLCTNVVDYLGQPKPAYHAVKEAWGQTILSIKHDGLLFDLEKGWSADLWLLTDMPLEAPLAFQAELLTWERESIRAWSGEIPPGTATSEFVRLHTHTPADAAGVELRLSWNLAFAPPDAHKNNKSYLFTTTLQHPLRLYLDRLMERVSQQ